VSTVLLVAGSDSSGGAGLVRDVRTLTRLDTRALCVVTAVTAQSDTQLTAVHVVPPESVRAQMTAALATRHVDAIKVGMLATRATVPVVLDPVLASSSGGELLDDAGRSALCAALLPRTTLLTPNIPEAAALLGTRSAGSEAELLEQAAALLALGPQAVLLKGGHGNGPEAADLLLARQAPPRWLRAPRISAARRGTGCALSSAIAAGLAAGLGLAAACERAKQHVTQLLQHDD